MKTPFLITAALLLCSFQLFSGTPNPAVLERVRILTLEGLEHAYNFNFKEANTKFDEAITVEPLLPRPHICKAMLVLWRYLLSNDEKDYNEFLFMSEKAIQAGEQYLDEHGDDAEALECLGAAYGHQAFARARNKSYLKAAWDGKKSYDYFYDAIKLDPHRYDAYLGIGMIHYYLTFVPKTLQWIISIFGVSGDSELGLKEIRTAADKGAYTKREAQYYLSQLLPWHDGDFDTSEKIISDLNVRYPNNTLFVFTRAVWEIRRNDVQSAKKRLEQMLNADNEAIPAIQRLFHYKLAECTFRLGEYARTIEVHQTFLKDYRDKVYVATSNYRIGLCYELLGKRGDALPYYQIASSKESRFGDDQYSARRAKERLATPLTYSDSVFVLAQNAVKSGKYDEAAAELTSLKNNSKLSSDEQAEIEYTLGEAFFGKNSFEEALQHYQQARLSPPSDGEQASSFLLKTERWILPWSHYQSGLCYGKLGKAALAKKEFELALGYEDYDFNNWLTFRSKRELEKMNR